MALTSNFEIGTGFGLNPADETSHTLVYVRSANGVEQEREVLTLTEGGFYRAVGQRQTDTYLVRAGQ